MPTRTRRARSRRKAATPDKVLMALSTSLNQSSSTSLQEWKRLLRYLRMAQKFERSIPRGTTYNLYVRGLDEMRTALGHLKNFATGVKLASEHFAKAGDRTHRDVW